jgi:hypothetical protein
LIAVLERGGHVGVGDLELFVVEGVEDAFVVLEGLDGFGNAPVFVDDEAIATVSALTEW